MHGPRDQWTYRYTPMWNHIYPRFLVLSNYFKTCIRKYRSIGPRGLFLTLINFTIK